MENLTWKLALVAVVALLLMPTASEACMTDDCQICWDFGCNTCTTSPLRTECTDCGAQLELFEPSRTTTVTFLGTDRAEITIADYSTTRLEPATDCVVAFAPVPGVEDVEAVINFNSETGLPFEEVTFHPALVPGPEAAELARETGLPMMTSEPWYGFQSHITGSVSDGVANHFTVHVRLEDGVTPGEFLDALKLHGAFLTSSSDENGVPTDHHNSFRQLGAGDLVVQFADGVDPDLMDETPRGERRFQRPID